MNLGRDFLLFRCGQLVSLIGDACTTIALPWWVLTKTGSAEKMALIAVPAMVAKICLLPMLGPIGDRFSRKRVAALGDCWSGIAALSVTVMAYFDYFNIGLLIILNVAIAAGSALFMSVTTSIIPQLVSKEQIPDAVQQGQAISMAGSIIGSLLGGLVVTLFGIPEAFLADALSFLVAAAAN